MIGRLLRRSAIWPIPPRLAGSATAFLLLTVALMASMNVHAFAGVMASAAGSTLIVASLQTARRMLRSTI
jgi:hypothetical protein